MEGASSGLMMVLSVFDISATIELSIYSLPGGVEALNGEIEPITDDSSPPSEGQIDQEYQLKQQNQ